MNEVDVMIWTPWLCEDSGSCTTYTNASKLDFDVL